MSYTRQRFRSWKRVWSTCLLAQDAGHEITPAIPKHTALLEQGHCAGRQGGPRRPGRALGLPPRRRADGWSRRLPSPEGRPKTVHRDHAGGGCQMQRLRHCDVG